MGNKKEWHTIQVNTAAFAEIIKAKNTELMKGNFTKTNETASRLILAGAAK
jgi:hypothetical protein